MVVIIIFVKIYENPYFHLCFLLFAHIAPESHICLHHFVNVAGAVETQGISKVRIAPKGICSLSEEAYLIIRSISVFWGVIKSIRVWIIVIYIWIGFIFKGIRPQNIVVIHRLLGTRSDVVISLVVVIVGVLEAIIRRLVVTVI